MFVLRFLNQCSSHIYICFRIFIPAKTPARERKCRTGENEIVDCESEFGVFKIILESAVVVSSLLNTYIVVFSTSHHERKYMNIVSIQNNEVYVHRNFCYGNRRVSVLLVFLFTHFTVMQFSDKRILVLRKVHIVSIFPRVPHGNLYIAQSGLHWRLWLSTLWRNKEYVRGLPPDTHQDYTHKWGTGQKEFKRADSRKQPCEMHVTGIGSST